MEAALQGGLGVRRGCSQSYKVKGDAKLGKRLHVYARRVDHDQPREQRWVPLAAQLRRVHDVYDDGVAGIHVHRSYQVGHHRRVLPVRVPLYVRHPRSVDPLVMPQRVARERRQELRGRLFRGRQK